MKRQKKVWLGVLIGAWLTQSLLAVAETSDAREAEQIIAAQWLQKMVSAVKTENYQGRSIFHNGNRMMSLKIIHGNIDGELWDRVVHLSGEPAEILRKGGKINCLHPESTMELSAGADTLMEAKIPLLKAFNGDQLIVPERYQLRLGSEGRVAGRLVQLVNVIPVDRARYGYQLGLDKETGLLLKTVMLNRTGKALEVFEFVDIAIGGPLSKDDFAPGKGVKWMETATIEQSTSKPATTATASKPTSASADVGWTAKWLPQGFDLAENGVRRVDGVEVNAQVYSDGLAVFTVFMEKLDQAVDIESSRQRGATVALSRRLAKPNDSYLVTVVGEVPMETAMQVAASVTKD